MDVSVPMRGFNDFNSKQLNHFLIKYVKFPSPCGVLMILIKLCLGYNLENRNVSVPMRGFNDFNKKGKTKKMKKYTQVSVPMRGFNDFNQFRDF